MSKFALNKSSLQKEREKQKLLERLLPSMDLKRRQLLLEFNRARDLSLAGTHELERLEEEIGQQLPMLANREIDVQGLLRLEAVHLGQENVVGVKVPLLREISFFEPEYSFLAKPAWVDVLVARLKEIITLRVKLLIAEKRAQVLDRAVRRITQRINLFEKILIPQTKQNIKKIQIFLSDAERAAVVRSKLAKSRRQRDHSFGEEQSP